MGVRLGFLRSLELSRIIFEPLMIIKSFRQVEKLLLYERRANLNDYDVHNSQRRCVDLKKQIDDYIKKAEAIRVDAKSTDLKQRLLEQLDNLSDDLALFINPHHLGKKSTMAADRIEQPTVDLNQTTHQGNESERHDATNGWSMHEGISHEDVLDSAKNKEFVNDSIERERHDHYQHEQGRPADNLPSGGVLVGGNQFIVIADFEAEENSDLSVRSGEIVSIRATRLFFDLSNCPKRIYPNQLTTFFDMKDGWWVAERSDGKRGLIPKTFLKSVPKDCTPVEQNKNETTAKSLPVQYSIQNKFGSSDEDACAFSHHNSADDDPFKNPVASKATWKMSKIMPNTVATGEEERMRTMPEKILKQLRTSQKERETCLGVALKHGDKVRKRRVRVSKIIRLLRLENVSVDSNNVHGGLIRICLFDLTGKTGRQIVSVSNIHTIKAQTRSRGGKMWMFISKIDVNVLTSSDVKLLFQYLFQTDAEYGSMEFSDFFIRSNYIQMDVVLLFEASVIQSSFERESELLETSLGYAYMPIIGENGHCCLQNKTYTQNLLMGNILKQSFGGTNPVKTQMRLVMRISDVSETIVTYVDFSSLSDILIWNPMFARLGFYYRRALGEVLVKERQNPISAEFLFDPFLATFPIIADQTDVMELIHSLWLEKLKSQGHKKKDESEEVAQFRQFYMSTALVVHGTGSMPNYDILNTQAMVQRCAVLKAFKEQYVVDANPIKLIANQHLKMLDVFSYAVDLVGDHAID
ncbi:unnamed protein product [Anisakis simplex]|uniref:Nephrocystin-1-like protein (inferred by orthology to a C. elegans protein) n=1 Tax=Anisakis simplex TaxID=6269 RepID=A0A158PNB9_ANISI|nr:unnamed protein product [Anisakis simplex]